MKFTPGLHVHLDTHPERLFDRLSDALIAEAAQLPLGTRQIVAVGAKGMARWLEQELARRHGICAAVEFPFPAKLVQRMLDVASPRGATAQAAVSREGLRWRIAAILGEMAVAEADGVDAEWRALWAQLRAGGLPDYGRVFEVAAEAARALDTVEIHRPGRMEDPAFAASRASPHADWLLALRDRIPELASDGFAARRRHLLSDDSPIVLNAEWPEELHLFGLSTVPTAYIEVLHAFGRRSGRAIHLYRTVPTPHWLADQTRRAMARGDEGLQPFVARQVQAARRMQGVLLELDERHGFVEDGVRFDSDSTGPDSLLSGLQSSWRSLTPVPPGNRVADDSLRLHVVHHPQREMEVLRDEIWKAIEDLPALRPRDILVLLPDVEAWSPWIRAVFEGGDLPWSIADRPARNALPGVEAWFALVEALAGRLTAGTVAALLDLHAWQRVFGFEGADQARLRTWIEASGARWGVDADDRRRLLTTAGEEGPDLDADFSWGFGLDRMVLGWLHGRGGDDLVAEFGGPRVPLAAVASDESSFAGLLTFLDWLIELRELAAAPRPIGRGGERASWPDVLAAPLQRLQAVVDDEDAQTLRQLGATLERLAEGAGTWGWNTSVDLGVFRRLVTDAWGEASPHSNFLGGGVTFAALAPLRGVPFRMVALCGFSEGTWPRPQPAGEFDLLAATNGGDNGLHAFGDPDRRAEDRLAFLEALLAARERLHVSWVGRDGRDGQPLPPALVVGELLDEIRRQFREAPPLIEHPIHAFASESSHSPSVAAAVSSPAVARAAAALRRRPRNPASPFWDGQSDLQSLGEPLLTVEELGRFWRSPARAWLRAQGIFVADAEAPILEEDPVALDRFAESRLVERLLNRPEATAEEAMSRFRGEAWLPPGRLGRSLFERVWQQATEVRAILPDGWGDPGRIGTLDVDLVVTPDDWPDDLMAGLSEDLRGALAALGPVRVRGQIDGWVPATAMLWSAMIAPADRAYVRWPAAWRLALARCAGGGSIEARTVALADKTEQPTRWRVDDLGAGAVSWLAAGALLGRAAPLPWEVDIAGAYGDAGQKKSPQALEAAHTAAGFGATNSQASKVRRLDLIHRIWGWSDGGDEEADAAGDAVWARYIAADGPLPPAETWWRMLAPPLLRADEEPTDGEEGP